MLVREPPSDAPQFACSKRWCLDSSVDSVDFVSFITQGARTDCCIVGSTDQVSMSVDADLVACSAAITACARIAAWTLAISIYASMAERSIKPNEHPGSVSLQSSHARTAGRQKCHHGCSSIHASSHATPTIQPPSFPVFSVKVYLQWCRRCL